MDISDFAERAGASRAALLAGFEYAGRYAGKSELLMFGGVSMPYR